MNEIELISKLSNANGAPGFEDDVIEIIKGELCEICEIEINSILNIVAKYKNKNKNKNEIKILLDAHSDEVAFMVQNICSNGLIKFLPLGGWWEQTILAHKVRIKNQDNKYIPAIVSSTPPHFLSEKQKNNVVTIKDMYLDVGAISKEQVINEFKINVGAPVIPDVEFQFFANNMMLGKAFDNRLGTAAAVTVMKKLFNKKINSEPILAISAQEEVGTRGALISGRIINPDIAIIFEGSPADDGIRDNDEIQTGINRGPHIRHRDSSMISNPRFVKFAREIAKKYNFKFQDAVRWAGGTNGGRIHLEHNSIPTIVIGIPVRYIHTHYCWSSYNDFITAVNWSKAIIENINKEIVNSF